MRKIDLSALKRNNRGNYVWASGIGKTFHVIWDDIECDFMIIGITKHDNKTYLRYVSNYEHDRIIHETRIEKFTRVSFSDIFINTKYKIGDVVNNNMIIEDIFYKNTKNNNGKKYLAYKVRCLKCNRISEPLISNLDKRTGLCPYCESPSGAVDITKEEIIRNRKQYEKYFFNKEDLYKYGTKSDKVIKFVCPNCGKTKEMKVSSFYTYGLACPHCSDGISYPNKIMGNLLSQLHVEFIPEFSPEWIGKKRYDFLLPDYDVIVEMDGTHHYKSVRGGLEEVKISDDFKTLEAIKHGFKIIRINCNYENAYKRFQYIKSNIINSDLFNILNINYEKIDWNAIELESQQSLMLKACELRNSDEKLSVSEISNILKISATTVTTWLKKGDEFGLCCYDAVLEAEKGRANGRKNMKKTSSKQIVCLEDGIKYKSIHECSSYIRVTPGNISMACRGLIKACKGLHFKYLKDLTLEEFTYYNCEQWLKDNDLWEIFVSKNKVV